MIEVVQAFDRALIAQLDSEDAAALDRKIETARRLFADRRAWLKPHQRIETLRKLAVLMESKREHLGRQIASMRALSHQIAFVEHYLPLSRS